MIYGRFGDEVKIVRLAVLDDVKTLDCRKAYKHDRERIAADCYVITEHDDGAERLSEVAYLRADEGWKEIAARICEVGGLKNA